MFGLNDNNQQSNDDPAMLDNVKQLVGQPSDQMAPAQSTTATAPSSPFAATPVAPTTPPPSFVINDQTTSAPTTNDQAVDTPVVDNPMPEPITTPEPIEDEHRAEPAEGFSSAPTPSLTYTMPPIDDDAQSATADDASVNDATTNDVAPDAPNSNDTSQSTDFSNTPAPTQEQSTEDQSPSEPADPDHLARLKQQALEHLEPLADHIDGTPEETFKTTMMMIQANDNHQLLEKALEAAKNIEDDKARANAMLDVINEINYFSQNQE